MNIEELKEFMKTEEFRSIAKDLNIVTTDEVQGLLHKRDELLGKNKTLSQKIAELEAKLSEVDLDEYAELKSKAAAKGQNDNNAQAVRELEKLKKQLEAEQAGRSAIEKEYNGALTKSAILEALGKVGIDKKHYGLLLEAFAGKAKVEVGDGSRTVLIGDDSVSDFFDKFAKGDGQIYVEQQENRGSGSSRMSGGQKTVFTREELKTPEGRKAYREAGTSATIKE